MIHELDVLRVQRRPEAEVLELRDQDRIVDARWTGLERTGAILGLTILGLVAFFALLAGLVWLFMP